MTTTTPTAQVTDARDLVGRTVDGGVFRNLDYLPDDTIIMPANPFARPLPLWRHEGRWNGARTVSGIVDVDVPISAGIDYRVLYVPALAEGDVVADIAALNSLPVTSAVIDDGGFIAQSYLDEATENTVRWTLTGYSHAADAEDVMHQTNGTVRVLRLAAS